MKKIKEVNLKEESGNIDEKLREATMRSES